MKPLDPRFGRGEIVASMDGMSSDEIADELGTSRRTVDRKRRLILAIRKEEFSE
jgi:DNA-binding CsgD family transcriptional regulator